MDVCCRTSRPSYSSLRGTDDTGVISATLVSIGTSLSNRSLSTLDKSLITSCTSLFALIASPITGILADRLGRKNVILVADILFVFGAVGQALTNSVWGMILGRSVVGLAVGSASFVVPLYIAELSPAPFRGRLVTLSILFITLGQVVSYVVGFLFSTYGNANGWRWMVGLGAAPAVVQFLMLLWMPETPRWLVKMERQEEARRVLNKVFGRGLDVQKMVDVVLRGIVVEVQEEEEAHRGRIRDGPAKYRGECMPGLSDNWRELFRVSGNRRALMIACLLQGLQQLCGFNSLMYFSATIFTLVGFTSPTLTSLSVAISNFLFTLLAVVLIDAVGRRRILLYSLPIMIFGLLLAAVGFFFVKSLPKDMSPTVPSSAEDAQPNNPLSESTAPLLILAALIFYVSGYAIGMGNVPWQQSELFPLSVRSLGSGLATATNWGANFVVGLTFLPMMERLTPSWTFVLYALVCVFGWAAIWRIYPETKGLSLEETGELLASNSPPTYYVC